MRAGTQRRVAEVEWRSGLPVHLIPMPEFPVLATATMSPHATGSYVIRYRAGIRSKDYAVAFQCGHMMSLTQGKDAADLGMAFYIALLSATLGRSIGVQLVVLGQMSLHGVLSRVEGLGDKLRVAMDAGARRVLIPTENSRDFATLPAEVLDKLRIEFYSEPSQAAFKALAE